MHEPKNRISDRQLTRISSWLRIPISVYPHGELALLGVCPLVESVGRDQTLTAVERGLECRTDGQRLAAGVEQQPRRRQSASGGRHPPAHHPDLALATERGYDQYAGRYRAHQRIAASVIVLATTTLIACFWQDRGPSAPAAPQPPDTPAQAALSTPTSTPTPTPSSNPVDRAALVALYNATNGPNWRTKTNWLSDRPVVEWYGVTTDSV